MTSSPRRLNFQRLESRRLLAASLDTAHRGLGTESGDFETDSRLIGRFHGPMLPGRPIPRIQGIALNTDDEIDDDFPIGQDDLDAGPLEAAPFPTDDTFKLHSRPNSNFTIYLDFDGHTTVGTTWNTQYGIDEIVHPNYWGGTGTDFSDGRLELIQQIWQVVAEDFAPFDVNVTTEEPADLDDLRYSGNQDVRWGTRAVMTKDTFADCDCGGHAFLGAFDDPQDEPALVYNSGLNRGSETVSHEVGHQFGLNHDGVGSTAYYSGHGSGDTGWGPIMGAPFSKLTTQWNDGDYFNASNPDQDDLSIITGSRNLPYAPDDHSDDRLSASPLEESSTTEVEAFGIIEQNDDVDWFRFTTGGGDISLDIDVLSYKPNLDAWVGLYDSSGAFIIDSNPQRELSASLQDVTLDAGEYFIKIDGVARDGDYDETIDAVVEPTPAPYTQAGPSGYSDYGSLGQYRIRGSIVDRGLPTVSIASNADVAVEGTDAEFTLTTSDGGSTDVIVAIRNTRQSAPGLPAPHSTEDADFSGPLSRVVSIVDGTATFQVSIVDDLLVESVESFQIQIADAGSYAIADRVAGMQVKESRTSFSIAATDADTIEGDPAAGATHRFSVSRNGAQDTVHTVGWRRISVGGSPADDADFLSAASGTIDFGSEENVKTIDVGVAGDLDDEADETYAIELFIPEGGAFQIEAANSAAQGRIGNDESIVSLASTAQFRLRQLAFSDGRFDNWAFDNFRITGTPIADDFDPEIDDEIWESIDAAIASSTFPNSDGNALFFTGSGDRTAVTIPASPIPGAQVDFSIIFADENSGGLNATESGEDAALEYSRDGSDWTEIERFDESEYTSWTDVGVVLPSEATFDPQSFDESNSGPTTRSISIPRSGYIDKAISVDWVLMPTGADPVTADDFVGGFPKGTANFSAGQSTASVEFQIVGDTTVESDETFLLSVTSNSGGPIPSAGLVGMIINDDFLLPEINVLGRENLPVPDGDQQSAIDDGTDLGLVGVDLGSKSQSFTIENLGSVDLHVNSIITSGTHADDFAISGEFPTVTEPGQTSTFDLTLDPSAPGRRDANVVIVNDDPDEPNYTFAVSGLATDLSVEAVQVNDDNSRSQIDSLTVTFNQIVEHQPLGGAFQIQNLSNEQSVRSITAAPRDVNDKTEVRLTFQSPNSVREFLEDGNYELRVLAASVSTPGAQSYPMFEDYLFGTDAGTVSASDAFFRLFGDTDGDRDVDGQDFGRFGISLFQDATSPAFDNQLDYDGDGDVDGQDYSEFGRRFLKTLGT